MSALPEGVTQERWQDIDVLRVETPMSLARISLHGGQVLSFAPTGFDDLLWVSPTTAMPIAGSSTKVSSGIRVRTASSTSVALRPSIRTSSGPALSPG